MNLVWPSPEHLPSYVAALERGWSPDNLRRDVAAREELVRIANDPASFLASLVDIEGTGSPITLLDGTTAPRLPGYRRWLWDGDFCGSIGFRWQRGTEVLPPVLPGPYRLFRRALEAAPRVRDERVAPGARGCESTGPPVRRAHHDAGQYAVEARHRGQRRRIRRGVRGSLRSWRRPGSPLSRASRGRLA